MVLEVKTDPEVPPLPPHITLEEAKHLTIALIKGDPREGSVIKETAKQVLASLVPGNGRGRLPLQIAEIFIQLGAKSVSRKQRLFAR